MKTLTYHQSQVIFRQGDVSFTMYDIVKGKVGIYVNYGQPDEKKVAELGDQQVLGEMGLIEYYPRSATAVALEEGTELNEISEEELTSYFRSRPEKVLEIMRQLSARIREMNEKLANACHVIYASDEENGGAGVDAAWLKEETQKLAEESRKLGR